MTSVNVVAMARTVLVDGDSWRKFKEMLKKENYSRMYKVKFSNPIFLRI